MGKKRLRKQYEVPKRLWDKERIEVETRLQREYGLKNKRELWKAQTILRKIRRQARALLAFKDEKKEQDLLNKVKTFLIRKDQPTLDDILNLDVRAVLDRRLSSMVFRKNMGKTAVQARQFISHGHVAVNDIRVDAPSYLVKFDEEGKIAWYGKPLIVETKEEKAEEPTAAPAAKKHEKAEHAKEGAEEKKTVVENA